LKTWLVAPEIDPVFVNWSDSSLGDPRLTQTIASVAAAAVREWEAAEEHFQMAMQQVESLPFRLEQAETRRFDAVMLKDRATPGDREKAQTLLREALESYTSIGIPRLREITQALLDQAAGGIATAICSARFDSHIEVGHQLSLAPKGFP
jgi:hypothetical protein